MNRIGQLLAGFAVLIFSCNVLAGTTGKVAGKVVDSQTGDPIIGASVLIAGTQSGAATDMNGDYSIINLPPGVYSVRASAVGYSPMLVQNVQITVDHTTTIDFKLVEASIQTKEVVVTERRPLVQRISRGVLAPL